jgi:AraC family transcriptional regulator
MMMRMEPQITRSTALKLVGCVYYGDPFHDAEEWAVENEVGKLWQRFMSLSHKYSSFLAGISAKKNVAYEVHIEPEEYRATKNYYVFVGVEVISIEEIPLEMFVKVLPETQYALFTTKLKDKHLAAQVLEKWIPQNGLEQAYPYVIEAYEVGRFRSVDDVASEIDWYIPVKEKAQQ